MVLPVPQPALDTMVLQSELPNYLRPTNSAYNFHLVFWNWTTDLRNLKERHEDPQLHQLNDSLE